MNPRWRWVIAAGVIVLVAVLLHVRMDTGRMRQVLLPMVSKLIHATIDYDRLSFTFVNGLDVRLDKVRIRHVAWSIESPTVLLELRVIPLLLGSIELQGIYLRSPVIRFSPQKEHETSTIEMHGLPRGLMLDQLSFSDATIVNETGQLLISGLDLDIRDIGPSRTLRWELQARTGKQTANGHGQLGLRFGTVDNGFGKLSLERIPLQALRDIPRLAGLTGRLARHGYSQLSTVITLSIGHPDQWTTFSETTLSGDPDRPPIVLRGKLYRDAGHALAWKDAFIQVGTNATLATDGGCDAAEACTAAIRGKAIDLAPFVNVTTPTTPAWQPVAGNMDVQADLHWQHQGWSLTGQAEGRGITWQDDAGTFSVPDFRLSDILALGKKDGIKLKSALISFDKHPGNLLANARYDMQDKTGDVHLRLEALQDAWAPVLHLASMIDPAGTVPVSGQGVMQGDLKLVLTGGKPDLRFSLDGSQAEVHIADAAKPAGITAIASGDWQPGIDDGHLVVTAATLGDSTLKGLVWQRKKNGQELAVSGIKLDMQALRKQGVHFPAALRPLQGHIAGNLSTTWNTPTTGGRPQDLWPGLPALTAQLDLGRFGTDNWQLQGHVSFDQGNATAQQLQLTGSHGSAELAGDIAFASGRGRVDIRQGSLSWQSGDALPGWLAAMHLRGRIKNLNTSWLGQNWRKIRARYSLDGTHLDIPELKAGLVDGNIGGRDLAFDFKPGSLALRGIAQIGALHIQKLPGLAGVLQGELTGKTFATLKFKGTLPFTDWHGWRGNGNVMIYVGHWRPQPQAGVTQAVHHFALFGFRFRSFGDHTSIRNIRIENAGGHYDGTARLAAGGRMHGRLSRRADGAGFALGGIWPHITRTPLPDTAAH